MLPPYASIIILVIDRFAPITKMTIPASWGSARQQNSFFVE